MRFSLPGALGRARYLAVASMRGSRRNELVLLSGQRSGCGYGFGCGRVDDASLPLGAQGGGGAGVHVQGAFVFVGKTKSKNPAKGLMMRYEPIGFDAMLGRLPKLPRFLRLLRLGGGVSGEPNSVESPPVKSGDEDEGGEEVKSGLLCVGVVRYEVSQGVHGEHDDVDAVNVSVI